MTKDISEGGVVHPVTENPPDISTLTVLQKESLNKALHPNAELEARRLIKEFGKILIAEARLLAALHHDDEVQSSHIKEAYERIRKEKSRNGVKSFCLAIGSGFFGVFLPGFITNLEVGRPDLVTLFTILGILGIIMIFIGIRE